MQEYIIVGGFAEGTARLAQAVPFVSLPSTLRAGVPVAIEGLCDQCRAGLGGLMFVPFSYSLYRRREYDGEVFYAEKDMDDQAAWERYVDVLQRQAEEARP